MNRPAVLAIIGPTASGKSAIAMAIAQQMPVEIISMDSAQVYRRMDIGTAKPTDQDRQWVPHHLIDIIEPQDSYSAGQFCRDAVALIDQIEQRGKQALLVGGTMLYFKALTEGLNELPRANEAIRAELEHRAADIGWPALHQELSRIDPDTAARLEPTDAQRIQRALEIFQTTGRTMTDALAKRSEPAIDTARIRCIALEPSDRAVLHQRIEQRFHAMINAGFIDEVMALRDDPELHAGKPAIRCVGYRQLWQWLDDGADPAKQPAAIASGIAATRQLAKRQLTWLRSMPTPTRIDCLSPTATDQALRALQ